VSVVDHAQKVLGIVNCLVAMLVMLFVRGLDVHRASAWSWIAAGYTLSCRVCCVFGRKAALGVFRARFGGEVFERCVLMKSHSGADKEAGHRFLAQRNFNRTIFHLTLLLLSDAQRFNRVICVSNSLG
jgi:hypothetical protein